MSAWLRDFADAMREYTMWFGWRLTLDICIGALAGIGVYYVLRLLRWVFLPRR